MVESCGAYGCRAGCRCGGTCEDLPVDDLLRVGYAVVYRYAAFPGRIAIGDTRPGYDKHHIVEQSQAENEGYSREAIDSPDNLVVIPRMKHWEINQWYQTRNPEFDWQTPREYLDGRSWAVKRSVGLEALRNAGVLKP